MRRLPQSTAYTVMLKVYLSSDGRTAATGKTVAITISKAGGAFANPNAGASNMTEVASGWYKFALAAQDIDTLGDLVVRGTSAACDDAEEKSQVVKATNGGLTALPDAAAEAAGGLFTRGTGAGQINQDANGRIDTRIAAVTAGIIAAASFASGALDAVWSTTTRLLTAGTNIVLAKGTGLTGLNDIAAGAAMTLTSGERTAIANEVEAQIIDETDPEKVLAAITDKIASVNPSLSGLTLAAIASAIRTELATELARMDAAVSSRLAAAGYTAPDNSGIGTAATAAAAAAVSAASADTKASTIILKTNLIPASPAAVGDIPTALQNADALRSRQLTESYAADGVAPTLEQALLAIQQFLQEKSLSGTTLTVKKLDGTTTAMTFTTNSATTPTQVSRAA